MTQRITIGLAVLWLSFSAAAQGLRDPTVPPVEAGLQTPSMAQPTNPVETEGMVVVVRDGKPYLMQGSRLVAVGAMVDGKQLEKITETEIWFRNGKQRLKVPRFMSEIQMHPNAKAFKAEAAKPVSP